ncbi:tetratricopeptide repeat protein [Horticoccus luteus]|uniref:Tetratricopeptide repeat protein n=1 Tax=Horticoccus luteus TaxID=2862869 RepID=A0A8F9TT72_9BACT|nr:tetratricopeptide repeat protein [Horticoccus luteus]QYM77601.1 tetratricopeptide repeat protein [Horticoccus luteus]
MRSATSKARFPILLLTLLVSISAAAGEKLTALQLFQAKRYAEAQIAYEQLAAADPGNAETHFHLGLLALRRNATDTAIAELERAVALDGKNSDYFAQLGSAYGAAAQAAGLFSKAGLARKCRVALEKAVELDPDNLDAREGLVAFYRQAPAFVGGGIEKAYAEAEEIKNRDVLAGSLLLAQLATGEKKYDAAFATLDRVLADHPDAYLALYAYGRIAAESGLRLDVGERHLRRCLELPPPARAPAHAAVQWRLGLIAEKRPDLPAARAAYAAALELDPAFSPARDALARLPKP